MDERIEWNLVGLELAFCNAFLLDLCGLVSADAAFDTG